MVKRLDQGHLPPKLEIPGLTCPVWNRTRASTMGGEHSRREPFQQLVSSYSEHFHMSPQPVENARDNGILQFSTVLVPSRK
jgi:hypothetical protein